jgi:hypothetical protein
MGLHIGFSSFSRGSSYVKQETVEILPPNPDPKKYKIIQYVEAGKYLIVELLYEGCTNYEGRKLLLFNCSIGQLKEQKFIDPHFDDSDKFISPIARFEPTEEGWDMALVLVSHL